MGCHTWFYTEFLDLKDNEVLQETIRDKVIKNLEREKKFLESVPSKAMLDEERTPKVMARAQEIVASSPLLDFDDDDTGRTFRERIIEVLLSSELPEEYPDFTEEDLLLCSLGLVAHTYPEYVEIIKRSVQAQEDYLSGSFTILPRDLEWAIPEDLDFDMYWNGKLYKDDELHDVIRVGGYPDDVIDSYQALLEFLENPENKENIDWKTITESRLSEMKEFWETYPTGIITVG